MESDCPFKLALLQGSIQTPVPGLQKRGQWRRGHSVLCPLPTRTISPRNQPFVHCLRDSDSQVGFVPTGIHRNLCLQPVLNGTLLGDKKKKGGGGENIVMIGLLATTWYEGWTSITLRNLPGPTSAGCEASLSHLFVIQPRWAIVGQKEQASHSEGRGAVTTVHSLFLGRIWQWNR